MYTEKVVFEKTNLYGCGDGDDVYTVKEFRERVECGAFIDYDGYGHPVKDKKADLSIEVRPSRVDQIPIDATHIVWYNR